MRLIHFAQALTLILLGITGYLAWEGQQAARGAKRELEHLKKAQAAEEAAKPVGIAALPSAPPTTITPPAPGTVAAPSTPKSATTEETPGLMAGGLPGGGLTVPKTVVAAEAQGINTNTLTALQQRVLAAKPVAKLKAVVREQGFIVVDAG